MSPIHLLLSCFQKHLIKIVLVQIFYELTVPFPNLYHWYKVIQCDLYLLQQKFNNKMCSLLEIRAFIGQLFKSFFLNICRAGTCQNLTTLGSTLVIYHFWPGGGGHHGTVVSNNGLHQCLLLFLKIMDLDKSLKGLTKKLRGLNKQRVGSGSCKKG